jgi:hypothetical protein
LGQTSPISTTSILTPVAGGIYRVSVFGEAFGIPNNGTAQTFIQVSGGDPGINVPANTGAGQTYGEFLFLGKSSTSLDFSVSVAGTLTSYDVYVVVEQLQ